MLCCQGSLFEAMFSWLLRIQLWKYGQQRRHPHGTAKTRSLPTPLNSGSSVYDKLTVWLVKDTASTVRMHKKVLSHKPGLGVLRAFIRSAGGARAFLILPPELEVCQRRSGAAEVVFSARIRMSLSCLGGRQLAFFECLSLASPTLALSLKISRRRPHSVHPWGMGNSACDPQKTYF